jgi:exodeoxyribonuclease-3
VVCVQSSRLSSQTLLQRCKTRRVQRVLSLRREKGYSGVGIYTRNTPDAVIEGIGDAEFDAEGRYLQADFGDLSVISLYLPSGSSSEERQAAKFRFMDLFLPRMATARQRPPRDRVRRLEHRPPGDRPQELEIQPEELRLPARRTQLAHPPLDEQGWVDTYRRLHPDATDACYTWWSNRGQAWAKNVGWRLDYQIATPELGARAVRSAVYKDQRFSDHAPLTVDYDHPHRR